MYMQIYSWSPWVYSSSVFYSLELFLIKWQKSEIIGYTDDKMYICTTGEKWI